MTKHKLNSLNEALRQFNLASKILKEDYGMDQKRFPEEEYDQENPDIAHYRSERPQKQGSEEEQMDMNLSKSDERIAQIREIALEGLQDYAQDVDCEAYQFYKKIWLMCDKAVSEKDSASDGTGN